MQRFNETEKLEILQRACELTCPITLILIRVGTNSPTDDEIADKVIFKPIEIGSDLTGQFVTGRRITVNGVSDNIENIHFGQINDIPDHPNP